MEYIAKSSEQMAIKWDTDSKIPFIETTHKFPLLISASGEITLSVGNAQKLLVILVGTEHTLKRNELATFFRAFLMNK